MTKTIEEILGILATVYIIPATYYAFTQGLTNIEWAIYVLFVMIGFFISYKNRSVTVPVSQQ